MKKKLLEEIQPALNGFITDLITLYNKIRENETALEREIERKAKEIEDNRVIFKQQEKVLRDKQQKLDLTVIEYNEIKFQLKEEASKYTKTTNELAENNRKVAELRQSLEGLAKTKEDVIRDQEKIKRGYEDKTRLLFSDENKLKQFEKDLTLREKRIKIVENTNLKNEKELLAKEQVLAEIELDIKGKQKQIKLEYKRLKLDG